MSNHMHEPQATGAHCQTTCMSHKPARTSSQGESKASDTLKPEVVSSAPISTLVHHPGSANATTLRMTLTA